MQVSQLRTLLQASAVNTLNVDRITRRDLDGSEIVEWTLYVGSQGDPFLSGWLETARGETRFWRSLDSLAKFCRDAGWYGRLSVQV